MSDKNTKSGPTIQPDETQPEPRGEVLDLEQIRKEARESAMKQERERVASVMDAARKLGLEGRAEELIKGNMCLDDIRTALIDERAAHDEKTAISSQHIEAGVDEGEKRAECMVEYMCHRGSPSLYPLTDGARRYMGYTMLDMARECCEQRGEPTRGLTKLEVAGMALRWHSTSDFPLILAAVTGKNLRQSYTESPKTYQPFSTQRIVPDFKTQRELMLSEAPNLAEILEGGAYTEGTFKEGQETWLLATYGRIFTITRKAIINDDLGAFTRIPTLLGATAARKENDIMWALFTANAAMADGIALFDASHSNYTASGGAPSVANLGIGRLAMRKQTGSGADSAKLNLRPLFLMAPAALETVIDQLLTSITPAVASNVTPNWVRGLTPIIEPRLDDNSATAWYLAANPAEIDTLVYGYLEGASGPYVETEQGFEVDGTKIKIRHDFGGGVVEYRGLYKNNGA